MSLIHQDELFGLSAQAEEAIGTVADTGFAATGTTQGTGAAPVAEVTLVSTASAAAYAITLPSSGRLSKRGKEIVISNGTDQPLTIFPPSGGDINGLDADEGISLNSYETVRFVKVTATKHVAIGRDISTPNLRCVAFKGTSTDASATVVFSIALAENDIVNGSVDWMSHYTGGETTASGQSNVADPFTFVRSTGGNVSLPRTVGYMQDALTTGSPVQGSVVLARSDTTQVLNRVFPSSWNNASALPRVAFTVDTGSQEGRITHQGEASKSIIFRGVVRYRKVTTSTT